MRLLSFPQILYTIKLLLNEGLKKMPVQNIWYHFKRSSSLFLKLLIMFLHMFWETFQISQRIAGFRSSRWFGLGAYIFSLRYLHRKQSSGFKLGECSGQTQSVLNEMSLWHNDFSRNESCPDCHDDVNVFPYLLIF